MEEAEKVNKWLNFPNGAIDAGCIISKENALMNATIAVMEIEFSERLCLGDIYG